MMSKKIVFALALGLVILLAAVSAQAAKPPIAQDTVIWKLTNPRVVDPGQTLEVPADPEAGFPGGIQTTGYILEAKAKSRHDNLIKNGTFRLELSLFTPKKDMPGQKAGRWYVQGEWIVDANGNPAAVKERHKLGTARGFIRTDLNFNPTTEPGNWTALATLPMSTTSARWARGEGTYSVNAAWEGDLFLQIQLWPQAQQPQAPQKRR